MNPLLNLRKALEDAEARPVGSSELMLWVVANSQRLLVEPAELVLPQEELKQATPDEVLALTDRW